MSDQPSFSETQYLGFNRFGLVRRMTVILFCFVFYFVSEDNQGDTADLFFYLGLGILIMSGGAMLFAHLTTKIEGKTLVLKGPITHKKVELDITKMANTQVLPYSKFIMNRPMFNLHRKKAIRFYTHGSMCVQFDYDGDIIKIGSQRPDALKRAIDEALSD